MKADVDAYQSQIDALIQPVKTALQQENFDYVPSDALAKDLDTITSQAGEHARKLRDARKQVQALVADAQTSPAGDIPLRQALADLDTRKARERNEAIQQAEDAARKQADAKLAELRAQAVKDEAASQERKLKAEMRRKKAEDPTIQDRYKPFLAKGRFVFTNRHSGTSARYSDIPAPASLRQLRESGALTNEFTFWAAGAGHGRSSPAEKHGYWLDGEGNDRPAWNGYPKTEEEHKLVKERYEEFLELAPIWVEMKLLLP